jgi:hypothetical protein
VEHVQAALMVAQHESAELLVHVDAAGDDELRDFPAGGHAGHRRVGRRRGLVPHPGHGWSGGGLAEVPLLQPAGHHADLALLVEDDIVGQIADGGQGRPRVGEHCEGHRLGVVDGHVPREAGFHRRVIRQLRGCPTRADGVTGHQQRADRRDGHQRDGSAPKRQAAGARAAEVSGRCGRSAEVPGRGGRSADQARAHRFLLGPPDVGPGPGGCCEVFE